MDRGKGKGYLSGHLRRLYRRPPSSVKPSFGQKKGAVPCGTAPGLRITGVIYPNALIVVTVVMVAATVVFIAVVAAVAVAVVAVLIAVLAITIL